ncbi:SMP-30/gluconolactonase/LRE family protein [Martelella sp. HB161492]|uniref:SMP-30/gluconolactonase/LRE family protein n=1 Tax=Martelella sp. HB161492 TaxID=2720726 RepID=UPI001591BACB|nr:SMP-30/gluconolactonase/LRE family protein [Martelella sp. HB161492]
MTQEIVFEGKILSNERLALGEGPGYDPATDTVWWFDILHRKLNLLKVSGRDRRIIMLPEMASVMAAVDEHRQLIAMETGLYFRDTGSGALTLHAAIEADDDTTRSNDGRVHNSGAIWISTMGKQEEEGAGAIYHVARGEVTKLYDKITIPNAICFSPEGDIGYFVDTPTGKLMQVALDPETGLPVDEPDVLVDTKSRLGGMDGAICDGDGYIWNARYGASLLDQYSPEGRLVARYQLPARQPTCPAFIGRDGGWMLVTSAAQHTDPGEEPNAGFTFALVTGATPRFDPPYRP